jgi:peroxiredoxin
MLVPPPRRLLFALVVACQPLLGGLAATAAEKFALSVSAFSLPTTDGQSVSLDPGLQIDDPSIEFHVLCFLGTECPLARVYGPRLQRMSDEYESRGVRFIGINSNIQDSMEELRSYASAHEIRFPVAKDYDRSVAVQIGATRTPEVFVIDRGGAVRYQGRIDDQYQPGIARAEATEHDLKDAVEQLLAGRPVNKSRTTAVGCLISLPRSTVTPKSASNVTFCDQVIRVLSEHCVDCHREGEIGPFALDDYDEVVGWADMCLEVIQQGRMPPWHANPVHGTFANARHMPDSDKQLLQDWVVAGTPYGDVNDLPPPKARVEGWQLPQSPHAVFQMSDQPFRVPAEGTVEYQYFVVDPGFEEDKWIRAVQVIPGNPAVVHHCIAFTRPPDGADFRDIGLLSAYVPGQRTAIRPDGYAQHVPAKSKIVFQMHYTPTGKPESDMTRIGLVFAEPEQVTHEVYALGGIEQEFEIPPHAVGHTVSGGINGLPADGLLLSVTPHMHLRGKSYRLMAATDGGSEVLLDVPHYDFNWQHRYELLSPRPLRTIRSLRFEATFDNSAGNPTNPDPNEHVTWGDQTWQEMAVTFIEVAEPIRAGQIDPPADPPRDLRQRHSEHEARMVREAEAFADRYIARFDKNGDGSVALHELPNAVRKYGYLDHNRDNHVSRHELVEEAYWRLETAR